MAVRKFAPPGIPEARVRHQRASITVAAGATETKTVTWDEAFADTAYAATAEMEAPDGTMGNSLRVRRVSARRVDAIDVVVTNDDSVNTLTGVLHAMAIHD